MALINQTKIQTDPLKKFPYYVNVIYPYIEPDISDVYIITRNGDRLDLLAEEYYENSALYWIIASANPDKVRNDSFFMTPGIQIRIPTDMDFISKEYNKINTRR
tara:strand:- start:86 stop:397 length:312 start_codon:yes stop_codon:yes gene_type:complete